MESRFSAGLRIQRRVISALMIRELATRFGRENIGFLWVVAEPLLFASLVGVIWRLTKGAEEHGVGIISFVASGYIPLVLFRSAVSRSVGLFSANGSLMYHRQIKIADFVLVRFLLEMISHMAAYIIIGLVLFAFGEFPVPADIGLFLGGWGIYAFFTLSLCFVLAPLSEMSSVLEKLVPVTVYLMIPFSGTFTMLSWLTPSIQEAMVWSPPAMAMEMMRGGLYGDDVVVFYSVGIPLAMSTVLLLLGLAMCRRVRRTLVVE